MQVVCEVRIDYRAGTLSLPLEVGLYDRTGRFVRRLAARQIDAPGLYDVVGPVGDLPAGPYFVALRLGSMQSALLTVVREGE